MARAQSAPITSIVPQEIREQEAEIELLSLDLFRSSDSTDLPYPQGQRGDASIQETFICILIVMLVFASVIGFYVLWCKASEG
jgi:hypothetical protein